MKDIQRPWSVLWSGWAASVFAVGVATIAPLEVPHARGVGFPIELRYAIAAPACLVVSVASAFAYRALAARSPRPRAVWTGGIFGLAVAILVAVGALGRQGLFVFAAPAVLGVAIALAWLIPRFVERPTRSRVGTVALAIVGAIEALGMVGAISSERGPRPGALDLTAEIPRAMFDADHKFIDLPSGARVHYVDEGKGETLLFLHGNPSWSYQWRDLMGGLRGSYRCIALDHPGFGLSKGPKGFGFTAREESKVVEEFVDKLGLHDVTLVLQDWGGPIGFGFAERRPELVRQLVFGSTWAWPTVKSSPRGQFSGIMGGAVGEFVQVNFNGFVELGMHLMSVRELTPDEHAMYTAPFRPVARRGVASFYPGQITASDYFVELEAGLPRLADKRALIFWALQDDAFPRSELERFEAAFPKHKTVELPNAKHFFFEDTWEQLVPEIRSFVASGRSASLDAQGARHD